MISKPRGQCIYQYFLQFLGPLDEITRLVSNHYRAMNVMMKAHLPRSFCDGRSASSFIIFPRHAGVAYVPPEMSKKSTPASSSHLITTHCSAKLCPPFMTVCKLRKLSNGISKEGWKFCRALTVLAVQFGRDDEFIRRELGFHSIYNIQNKSRAVFETSTILDVSLVCILIL